MLKKGEEIEVKVEDAAFEGAAVARLGGFVVFIPYAAPGEGVRARVIRRKKKFAEAVLLEVLQPSPHRVTPRCPYFTVCGGCTWQHVSYEEQLRFKRNQVEELLRRVGGFHSPEVEPVVPASSYYEYRNKMEFSFGNRRWLTRDEIEGGGEIERDFALGLHIPGRFDRILDLEVCHLQCERSVEIVNRVRELALRKGWTAYDNRNHVGYLRNLVIRTGRRTGEMMVYLVTRECIPERMRLLTEQLLEVVPDITTVVNGVNPGRSPVAAGEQEKVYHGEGVIRERISHLEFEITPTTFFQPNTEQAERLYELTRGMAELKGSETVYDLYCGTGGISLFLADSAARVVGVESQARSVRDAWENALRNEISNCTFRTADAAEALRPRFQAENGSPDVAVLDPPRSGLHPDVCRALLRNGPDRLVYVSCNPATQARDLKVLEGGYEILKVRPVDMFPQTYHIETVVGLRRRPFARRQESRPGNGPETADEADG